MGGQLECLVLVPERGIGGAELYARCSWSLDKAEHERFKHENEYRPPERDLPCFVELGKATDVEGCELGRDELVVKGLKEEYAAPVSEFLASEEFQEWLYEQADLCVKVLFTEEDACESE